MELLKQESYTKFITPFYQKMVNLDEIIFAETTFKVEETRKGKDRLPVD